MFQNLILLVEDEDALSSLIRQLLQRVGFKVISARSMDEALGVLAVNGPAIRVVLIDWSMMDGASGEQLARHVGQVQPGTRLILMSGLLPKSRHGDAWPPGWVFLEKPFLPGELCKVVHEALSAACPCSCQQPA